MASIHKKALGLTWLLMLFFISTVPVQGADLDDLAALEAFFDGVLTTQLRNHNIPGATVAVVKGDEILFSKGYGFADLENKVPMDPEMSLHRPGSNSKLLVWTAIMQLVEQGHLDLYADINTYLDFSIPARISAGIETPPITLHHLMTHTSGFEDEVSFLFVSEAESIKPLSQYVKEHLPEQVFIPGSVMAYSNYGTSLAAYIVELVSGQPFAEYAKTNILEPLHMTSSTFAQPLPDHLAVNLSEGYRYEAGQFVAGGFEYVQSYPAGGLTSTTHDMARLIMAQLNTEHIEPEIVENDEEETSSMEAESVEPDDLRILQEETIATMHSQQFTGHPAIPGMTYGFIEADYNGRRVLSHGGDTFLFTTGLYFLPAENIGLYVAYNAAVGEVARRSLFEGFMDRYYPQALSAQVEPEPITPGTESNYTGIFHNSRSNFSTIESLLRMVQPLQVSLGLGGYLAVSVHGDTSLYGEIAPGLFQELNGNSQIAFTFQDGQATQIHMGGPGTWLRTPWHQDVSMLAVVLGVSVLIMLLTILGWIRGVFQSQPRQQRQRGFTVPKTFGILFILLFTTIAVLLGDVLNATHPTLGIPLLVLEPSSTLSVIMVLTKVLVGLSGLMLIATIYLVIANKATRWQRIYYALLTLSSLSVTLILWRVNLL